MNVRKIINYPNKILREKSKEIPMKDIGTKDFDDLCDSMLDTLKEYKAQGLAAIQIGVPLRLFVTNINNNITFFINPIIYDKYDKELGSEGCLSFPTLNLKINRYRDITVKALDRNGSEFIVALDGADAIAAQHENDHLDGVLFIDYLGKTEKRLVLKKLNKIKKKLNK